jgi:hypothetical protein
MLAVLAGALTACGPSDESPRATPATSTTTSTSTTPVVPATTPSTTDAGATISPVAVPGTTAAALRLVVCPTTYGVTPPAISPPLPTTMVVEVPSSQAKDLEIFTDSAGRMKLLGLTGWTCRAEYGADGSGGVAVYQPGTTLSESAFGAGWALSADSTVEAIVGSQTSACQGCGQSQACPLFQSAAHDFASDFGRSCPESRPATEEVDQLSAGVAAFEDPPGVTGAGSPSGGAFPANGVETYYAGSEFGSWLDTCTLPGTEKALCTTVLDNFVSQYGQN